MSKRTTSSTVTASSSSPDASSTDTPKSVCKNWHKKSQDKNDAEVPFATLWKELQSPQRQGYSLSCGSNHGDSTGDLEPSQDIVWDAMSPPNAGAGPNVRTLEIAEIVNLIAPKDTKPKGPLSPLWQWMGSPTALTPEVPKARVRKKSARQNSVNELIRLARQFDDSMQQDKQVSAQRNNNNNEIGKAATETPSPLNQTEAELRALFDSTTQNVSGSLSPISSKSSQDKSQLKKSSPAPHKIKESSSKCADFDDDWENDDMLNDPSLLALIQNPHQDSGPVRHSTQTNLRDLSPKVKPTTRSTFKLEPNPYFQKSVQRNRETAKNKISDSKWDDRDDDALFYNVCDSVERLSQPTKTTTPLPIHQTLPANKKSPRTFMRSNSLPGETLKVRQGCNALVSKSLPAGGHLEAGREPSQAAFKRSVCHTAVKSSKVFVTNQMADKCSAAEIERKKQEALARRWQRMQNAQKP
ncbi:uncharacterized protein LOC109526711 [Hippocampus comes]|uniref:uncharacterized protein LOC109526711 n=1 Tax=Hippocampus comes TaxID=109280 RepID=UPI00094EC726|nr:PREDICTED: ewing's tumor-associated antigen 1 [Hippocampus comes]XP_019743723.1 PREDICTED: ewing's tumor-associated antigen 1 [Hippocampus comes]